jgi:uncharacterized protein
MADTETTSCPQRGVRPPPSHLTPPFPLTFHQTITWTEIPCTDLERVQTFYSTVFGWNINPSPNSEVSFFTKGVTNGSFVKLEPENLLSPAIHPDNPDKGRVALRVTINVESVDEILKEVEKAGGSLYM